MEPLIIILLLVLIIVGLLISTKYFIEKNRTDEQYRIIENWKPNFEEIEEE